MNIPLWIINQFVFSDSVVFNKVSTAIRITADMQQLTVSNSLHIGPAQTVAQRAIKMSRILSQSLLGAIIFLYF